MAAVDELEAPAIADVTSADAPDTVRSSKFVPVFFIACSCLAGGLALASAFATVPWFSSTTGPAGGMVIETTTVSVDLQPGLCLSIYLGISNDTADASACFATTRRANPDAIAMALPVLAASGMVTSVASLVNGVFTTFCFTVIGGVTALLAAAIISTTLTSLLTPAQDAVSRLARVSAACIGAAVVSLAIAQVVFVVSLSTASNQLQLEGVQLLQLQWSADSDAVSSTPSSVGAGVHLSFAAICFGALASFSSCCCMHALERLPLRKLAPSRSAATGMGAPLLQQTQPSIQSGTRMQVPAPPAHRRQAQGYDDRDARATSHAAASASVSVAKFCGSCGVRNDAGTRFCVNCGVPHTNLYAAARNA